MIEIHFHSILQEYDDHNFKAQIIPSQKKGGKKRVMAVDEPSSDSLKEYSHNVITLQRHHGHLSRYYLQTIHSKCRSMFRFCLHGFS